MFTSVHFFAMLFLYRNWEPIIVFTKASAVSLRIPRSHWACGSRFFSLIETAQSASAVSLKLLNPLPRSHWYCRSQKFLHIVLCWKLSYWGKIMLLKFFTQGFHGLIETAEVASAVSLKSRKLLPWSHWNCWIQFCSLNETVEASHFKQISRIPR
jgi:hypothetical protein